MARKRSIFPLAGGQVPHAYCLIAAPSHHHRRAVQLPYRHRFHRAGVISERPPIGWPVARSHTPTLSSPLPETTTGR